MFSNLWLFLICFGAFNEDVIYIMDKMVMLGVVVQSCLCTRGGKHFLPEGHTDLENISGGAAHSTTELEDEIHSTELSLKELR